MEDSLVWYSLVDCFYGVTLLMHLKFGNSMKPAVSRHYLVSIIKIPRYFDSKNFVTPINRSHLNRFD